jgi:hypothetical protein
MSANNDPVTIPFEDIAVRAYHFWEERGSPIGSAEEDWFRAEEQLRSENTGAVEKAEGPAAETLAAAA